MRRILVGTTGPAGETFRAAVRLAGPGDEVVVLELEPAVDARAVFDPDGVPVERPVTLLQPDRPELHIRARRGRGRIVTAVCEAATAERPDLIVVRDRRAARSLVVRSSCPVVLVAS